MKWNSERLVKSLKLAKILFYLLGIVSKNKFIDWATAQYLRPRKPPILPNGSCYFQITNKKIWHQSKYSLKRTSSHTTYIYASDTQALQKDLTKFAIYGITWAVAFHIQKLIESLELWSSFAVQCKRKRKTIRNVSTSADTLFHHE